MKKHHKVLLGLGYTSPTIWVGEPDWRPLNHMNFKLSYGQGEISQSHGSMRCSTICFTLSWWQIRHFESWLCLYLCICICLWIYICICICVCPSQYKLHHSLVVANMTLWKLTPAVIRPWSTLASHTIQIQIHLLAIQYKYNEYSTLFLHIIATPIALIWPF